MSLPNDQSPPRGVTVYIRDESLAASRKVDRKVILRSADVTLVDLLRARLDLLPERSKADQDQDQERLQRAIQSLREGRLIVMINDLRVHDVHATLYVRDDTVITFMHMSG